MSFERGFNQKREARLKLGSISEVWREKDRWDKFVEYLVPLSEGDDSDGKPMSLSRYARFLELYVQLDQLGKYPSGTYITKHPIKHTNLSVALNVNQKSYCYFRRKRRYLRRRT